MKNRYIVAIDGEGVYFRETLSVTHDANAKEVVYHTKPINRPPVLKDRKSMSKVLAGATKATLIDISLNYREGYFAILELLRKEKKSAKA